MLELVIVVSVLDYVYLTYGTISSIMIHTLNPVHHLGVCFALESFNLLVYKACLLRVGFCRYTYISLSLS